MTHQKHFLQIDLRCLKFGLEDTLPKSGCPAMRLQKQQTKMTHSVTKKLRVLHHNLKDSFNEMFMSQPYVNHEAMCPKYIRPPHVCAKEHFDSPQHVSSVSCADETMGELLGRPFHYVTACQHKNKGEVLWEDNKVFMPLGLDSSPSLMGKIM